MSSSLCATPIGRTLMTMALTGQSNWRHSTPYGQSVYFSQANDTYRGHRAQDCIEDLADTVRTQTSGRIAAFYAEPINGVGGVITPEPKYFPGAYEVVKKAGGLFIADEVQTGMGRTGKTCLGIEKWGVKPDIVTMAKRLANGYPIGCVITTPSPMHERQAALQRSAARRTDGRRALRSRSSKTRNSPTTLTVGTHLIAALRRSGRPHRRGAGMGLSRRRVVSDALSKQPVRLALKVSTSARMRAC